MEKIEKDVQELEEAFSEPLKELGISRRSFIKYASVMAAAVMLLFLLKPPVAKAAATSDSNMFVYVGNWGEKNTDWKRKKTHGKGLGIFKYNAKTGEIDLIKNVFGHISVGETCLDSKRNILYVVDECMTLPENYQGGGGQVYAFKIDPETGDLKELNHQPSYGCLASYVAVDADGKYVIVTNHVSSAPITKIVKDNGKFRIAIEYDTPTTVLFRLNEDGSIGEPTDIYIHTGRGALKIQTHPHIHSVMRSPFGNMYSVCDKGADNLFIFRINYQTEKLEIIGGKPFKSVPGSSPRYSAFHPTSRYLYMNHETKPIVSAFRYDKDGKIELISTVDAVSKDFKVDKNVTPKQSDIRVHPSGKYLYDLIRVIDAVSVFKIKEETGELEIIQTVKINGKYPRGFAISPDGRFLHIAAINSKKVLLWAIGEDGKISDTGKSYDQPNPGNITFFSR